MQEAIEFETIVKNRNVDIPSQYSLNNKKVRVIILSELELPNKKIETKPMKLTSIIAQAKGKGCFKSVSEINSFIRNERNQWD
ncbi:MAG: hypothetical protein KAI83_14235 [Thiomargarita sp.]|nr:hypothetical protein [Thiomargarita sp.]